MLRVSTLECPECGGPREEKALYCPFCGAVFARLERRRETPPPAPPRVPALGRR